MQFSKCSFLSSNLCCILFSCKVQPPPCLLLFLQPHHIYARAPHSTYDDHIFLPINPGVQGAKSAIMSGLGLDDIDDVCEDKSKNVDDNSEDGARDDEKAMAVV